MSRSPPGFSGTDIRSAAILEDFLYETDPCAPGARIRRSFGRSHLSEIGIPPCGFDKPKYFTSLIAAFFILFVIIGLLHNFSIFIPIVQVIYNMGFVETCFAAALTYAVLIKICWLSCFLICWVGHRQTALIGMIIIFIGIILDSQVIHPAVFYISHILFFGIGGGLAYGSAMSLSGDLFRKHLATALIITSIAGCLGTIFFHFFIPFLMHHISYKWTKLCLSLFVLVFTTATHLFPSFAIDDNCDVSATVSDKTQRDMEIKQCVNQAARRERFRNFQRSEQKNLLCVCVCDISLWSDWSFLLWGICVFIATMALFVPYMYIVFFSETIEIVSIWYIPTLCIGSMVGRIIVLVGNDHTFSYNRILFIGPVVVSGILWISVSYIQTIGWLIVWCLLMGVLEGVIVCAIPRLTLVTIPRKWINNSWGWILCFHALGVLIITIFVAVAVKELNSFTVAFTSIGIAQIIGGIIAILLPNEEETLGIGAGEMSSVSHYSSRSFSSSYSGGGGGGFRSNAFMRNSNFKSFSPPPRNQPPQNPPKNYGCDCPICRNLGCFPECKGCIPGGLAGVSRSNPKPCGDQQNSKSEAPKNETPQQTPKETALEEDCDCSPSKSDLPSPAPGTGNGNPKPNAANESINNGISTYGSGGNYTGPNDDKTKIRRNSSVPKAVPGPNTTRRKINGPGNGASGPDDGVTINIPSSSSPGSNTNDTSINIRGQPYNGTDNNGSGSTQGNNYPPSTGARHNTTGTNGPTQGNKYPPSASTGAGTHNTTDTSTNGPGRSYNGGDDGSGPTRGNKYYPPPASTGAGTHNTTDTSTNGSGRSYNGADDGTGPTQGNKYPPSASTGAGTHNTTDTSTNGSGRLYNGADDGSGPTRGNRSPPLTSIGAGTHNTTDTSTNGPAGRSYNFADDGSGPTRGNKYYPPSASTGAGTHNTTDTSTNGPGRSYNGAEDGSGPTRGNKYLPSASTGTHNTTDTSTNGSGHGTFFIDNGTGTGTSINSVNRPLNGGSYGGSDGTTSRNRNPPENGGSYTGPKDINPLSSPKNANIGNSAVPEYTLSPNMPFERKNIKTVALNGGSGKIKSSKNDSNNMGGKPTNLAASSSESTPSLAPFRNNQHGLVPPETTRKGSLHANHCIGGSRKDLSPSITFTASSPSSPNNNTDIGNCNCSESQVDEDHHNYIVKKSLVLSIKENMRIE